MALTPGRLQPSGVVPRGLTRRERRARLLFGLAIAGSSFLALRLPLNLAPADVLLALLEILGVTALLSGEGGPFRAVLRNACPFLWLLALAALLSLWGIGITGWAVDHTMRDLLSLIAFPLFGAYFWSRRRIVDDVMVVFVAVGVVVALSTIVWSTSALRQTGGFFRNPNYTAHFLATAIIVTAYAKVPRAVKVGAILVMLLGIVRTGSFGGPSVLVGSLLVLPYRWCRLFGPGARTVARILLLGAVVGFVYLGATTFQSSDVDLGSGASSARFDRSSSTRLAIWQDALSELPTHPMGVGEGGLTSRADVELRIERESHNDYIAFLVETGVLGLIGFLGICIVVWRSLPRAGSARLLMVGFALSACFREVVNFRHIWLALVLLALRDYNEGVGVAEMPEPSAVPQARL